MNRVSSVLLLCLMVFMAGCSASRGLPSSQATESALQANDSTAGLFLRDLSDYRIVVEYAKSAGLNTPPLRRVKTQRTFLAQTGSVDCTRIRWMVRTDVVRARAM